MVVRFKNSPSAAGFAYVAGKEYEVPQKLGLEAIAAGVADLVKEEKVERATAKPKKETAVKKRKRK